MADVNGSRRPAGKSLSSPSRVFTATFLALNVVPGAAILLFGLQENLYSQHTVETYTEGARLFLLGSALFLTAFSMGAMLARARRPVHSRSPVSLRTVPPSFIRICRTLGIVLLLIYLATDGLSKLTQLGGGLGAWEFRTYTVNNAGRLATAAIEISRRIFLPIWVSRTLAAGPAGEPGRYRRQVALGAICLLLAAAATLDRYPFLLSIALFAYVQIRCSSGVRDRAMRGATYAGIAVMVGGAVSMLQRNVISFGPMEAIALGWEFLMGRLLTVPAQISIELSFIEFPVGRDRLNLQYTRLNALFGGRYLRIGDADARFVTPVGAVGDLWRNLGFTGIGFCALFLGILFGYVDRAHRASTHEAQVVLEFMSVSLGFYMVYGVFFSQGVFASIAAVVGLAWVVLHSRKVAVRSLHPQQDMVP